METYEQRFQRDSLQKTESKQREVRSAGEGLHPGTEQMMADDDYEDCTDDDDDSMCTSVWDKAEKVRL